MVYTRLMRVDVSGVTVTSGLISAEWTSTFGNPIDNLEMDFRKTLYGAVPLSVGQTVDVYFDSGTASVAYFQGELDNYEPEKIQVKLKAFDKMYRAVQTRMDNVTYQKDIAGNVAYPSGVISYIFTDLITNASGYNTNSTGLSADTSSVVYSASGTVFTKFVCDNVSVKDRCDKCAEALGWIYGYDADTAKVFFRPKQSTTNSTTLEVGVNVLNVPKWTIDKTDLINDLRLDGAIQYDRYTEVFTGAGTVGTFTLAALPVGDVIMYYNAAKNYATGSPLPSEKKTLGITGSTTGAFDFTVDRGNKQVTTTFSVANSANDLLVNYVGARPTAVQLRDDVSVAQYGLHSRAMQLTDTITVADAISRIRTVFSKFKNPFRSTTLWVRHTSGYKFTVGESIRVVDNINNPPVDGVFTIFSITRLWPSGYDEIKVGDREFDPPEFFINLSERINRLERETSSDSLLTLLRDYNANFTPSASLSGIVIMLANDSFIAGDATNGIAYSGTQAFNIDDFETTASWVDGTGTLVPTIAGDSASGHFWTQTQGVNITWTGAGTVAIKNSVISKNMSTVTGAGTGTPAQGTAGVWVYPSGTTTCSGIVARLGSSSSAYKGYIGQTYRKKVDASDTEFNLAGRTLVLFDLNSPDETAGTANWASVAYARILCYVSGSGSLTFDQLDCSMNDTICHCPAGDRRTILTTLT